MSDTAEQAADQVLEALRDRRGLGQELDRIEQDPETWQDIRSVIAGIVRRCTEAREVGGGHE